jgi:hypothetical protein
MSAATGSGVDVGCGEALADGVARAALEAEGVDVSRRPGAPQATIVRQLSVPHADATKDATRARATKVRTLLFNARPSRSVR